MAEDFVIRPDQNGRLGLWFLPEPRWKPISFRWDSDQFLRRMKQDLLFRSVSGRTGKPVHVIDATLGLGCDALALLHQGCTVTAIERNPLLQKLWEEAIRFYSDHPIWAEHLKRFHWSPGEAADLIPFLAGKADVIYIDPMHEEKQDSVSPPKKEMQMIRRLVGHDSDSGRLFSAALSTRKRVVVKRPDKTPPLAGLTPHHSLRGKTVRFDVYEPQGG